MLQSHAIAKAQEADRPGRAWLEIDLGAIQDNLRIVRRQIGAAKIMAIVKSDAYGHGLPHIARFLDANGVEAFAVICLDEAKAVREQTSKPVLILGYLAPHEVDEAVELGFRISLYEESMLAELQRASRLCGKKALAHVKVESGLNRLGLFPHEAIKLLNSLDQYPEIGFEAFYSHLAKSADRESNRAQWARFEPVAKLAKSLGMLAHLTNSDALRTFPEGALDYVRIGLALYGVDEALPGVRPALTCKTVVMQVKHIEQGDGVSYGHLFVAEKPTDVAVIALGYGEGYTQLLTGYAEAVVAERRVPVIGKICMNLMMLDVTGLDVKRGDEVVMIGSQGEARVTVAELAQRSGLRHHEVLTRLGASLPRVYSGA